MALHDAPNYQRFVEGDRSRQTFDESDKVSENSVTTGPFQLCLTFGPEELNIF